MEDSVTIGASVAVRSVRDAEHGVYEYLEEQHPLPSSPERTLALPVCLSGWLWRREGFGIFRRYRRRFCVFKAEQATLFIYADDDTLNGKQLRGLVLTKVTLTSRADRIFVVQGHLQDREVHKEASDSMVRRASTLSRNLLPRDTQMFFSPEEERFKAVSAKACSVWTHCFKYHMKSYALRRQEAGQEHEQEEAERDTSTSEMDPNFVFEDATKSGKRRHTLPGSSFRSFGGGSGLFTASRSRSKSRGKLVVGRRESLEGRDNDAPKSAPQFEENHKQRQDIAVERLNSGAKNEELEPRAATKISQNQDEVAEEENPILVSDLPCISSIWEDEELLSHCVDYDAIIKEEKLAAGANGEVWRAMHRSQEVVVKNLLGEVMTGSKSPTSSNANEVTAVYRRRRAILNFVEEIRIMSRLEHNRIVEFRGVAVSAERGLLLVMEYLPRGDLRTFLNTVKRNGDNSTSSSGGSSGQYLSIWTWTKSQWRLAIDIIEGLVYLHSLNPPLVHGDLKSANVLLRSNLRAKLTDFGLSRYLLSEDECLGSVDTTTASEENPTTSSSSRYGSRARGTGRWMAPELLTSGAHSSMASDVYAFGIVLSEIDTCELPFTEREKLVARSHTSHTASAGEDSSEDSDSRLLNESMIVHKIVAEGWKPTFRVTCPEVIKKLAQECLLPDPNARPTSLAVAHRLRKAATKRERPEALAAQAKATTSLRIR
ncbi:TKL protein kinase [Phytophthora nicotianae]|uniref:TKL protein kinase n=1 Tax=Phytophthora nicotianae TaxID=4792 RepID=W2I384_PHYNI|nr:TKL protein kinase [Phytophthora nicotianae]ETL28679.1 TKL protein kinase [Phytophthora nicotianae]